jgi:hypothetical protein
LKTIAIALLIALFACPAFSDDTARGWLCVGPFPARTPSNAGLSLCDSGKLSLQLDKGEILPWPRKESLKIEDLDLTKSHLVIARCNGKPVQSARFKFSGYNTDKLCLTFEYLADGYEGMRLWDAKHVPWCKCK